MSFSLWGIAYACWQIPIAAANQPLTQPLFFAGRILTHAGTVFFASFTWATFRNQSRWAKYLVFAIAISLDRVNGTIEIATVALVCLIYFPPRFYRRWIAGAAPAAEPEEA